MSANGQTVVPEARGKAMAMQAWMAQAGNLRGRTVNGKRGKETYKSGPMAGLTQEQAKVKFESIWAGAAPELKDTYAAKARNSLSPSERKEYDTEVNRENARKDSRAGITGLKPTPPPTRTAPTPTAQKPAAPAPPAQTSNTTQFKELPTPPPVPVGGAKSVGDGSDPSTNTPPQPRPPGAPPAPGDNPAPAQAQVPGVNPTPPSAPTVANAYPTPFGSTVMGAESIVKDTLRSARDAVIPPAANPTPSPTPFKDTSTPFGRIVSGAESGVRDMARSARDGIASMFRPDVDAAKNDVSESERITAADKVVQGANAKRAAEVAAVRGTTPPPATPTPAPATPPTAATPPTVTTPPTQTAPPVGQTSPQISGIQPTPTQGRPEPTRSALAPAPDFTPGPNKELTGMSAGRPTYSSADSLYGKGKIVPGNSAADIKQTMNRTPLAGDPTKPVMTGSNQSMDQRRADYQNRSNTPQSQQGAINSLRSSGINNAATKDVAAVPGLSPTPPPNMQSRLDNPNSAYSKEAMARTEAAKEQGVKYAADQAKKPTMDDVNRRYKPGTAENKSAAWGVNPTTGGQLTKDDLAVNVRPATSADKGMKLGVPYSRGFTRK